jgi:hypothetical protein
MAFPVKQGKNREFLRFRVGLSGSSAEKSSPLLGFCVKFPKSRNRDFRSASREIIGANRELFGPMRELVFE